MKEGDYIKTPRFLTVKIKEVFNSYDDACKQKYTEPTHYDDDPNFDVFGKHIGENRMFFAAVKKNGVSR